MSRGCGFVFSKTNETEGAITPTKPAALAHDKGNNDVTKRFAPSFPHSKTQHIRPQLVEDPLQRPPVD